MTAVHEFAITPYFHPTTICFVDDNESFLRSLELELPGNWACRMFSDPREALDYLEAPPPLPALMDRCFTLQWQGSDAIIRLNLDLIEQEINHVERFRRNSVVVIDYSMPSMNGLELCAALTDPLLRKAMLTGVADEKVAVAAFNAGLLHRFIPKNTVSTPDLLRSFVDTLQQDYFSQYTARLKNSLAIDPPTFLTEPAIAAHVAGLMRKHKLIEYYLVDEPPGLLMLDSAGRIFRLVALRADQQRAQVTQALANNAPAEVSGALSEQRSVACFSGEAPEDYFGVQAYPWAEKLRPATIIEGNAATYLVALFEDAAADIDFDPARASYDAYLATL